MKRPKLWHYVQLYTGWMVLALGFNFVVFGLLGFTSFNADPVACAGIMGLGIAITAAGTQYKADIEEEIGKYVNKEE